MDEDKINAYIESFLPIYLIYARKSKFTGKGESIQNQIDCCKTKIMQMAAMAHITISEDQIIIFKDEGFSGGNTDRPAFQQMMTLCRSKKLNIKARCRTTRLFRKQWSFQSRWSECIRMDYVAGLRQLRQN